MCTMVVDMLSKASLTKPPVMNPIMAAAMIREKFDGRKAATSAAPAAAGTPASGEFVDSSEAMSVVDEVRSEPASAVIVDVICLTFENYRSSYSFSRRQQMQTQILQRR